MPGPAEVAAEFEAVFHLLEGAGPCGVVGGDGDVGGGGAKPYRKAIIRRWHELGAETPEVSVLTFTLLVKDGAPGVDLRELHRELRSGQDFSTWAKQRIEDFIKGQDYEEVYAQTGENSGGRPRRDWAVSIDCN